MIIINFFWEYFQDNGDYVALLFYLVFYPVIQKFIFEKVFHVVGFLAQNCRWTFLRNRVLILWNRGTVVDKDATVLCTCIQSWHDGGQSWRDLPWFWTLYKHSLSFCCGISWNQMREFLGNLEVKSWGSFDEILGLGNNCEPLGWVKIIESLDQRKILGNR